MNLVDIITLSLSIIAIIVSIVNILINIQHRNRTSRLDFLNQLFSNFSTHNWNFIKYWDFPGIYPNMRSIEETIPEKKPEYQKPFGNRVTTLEHLNILLKVFTYKNCLNIDDIEGFTNWALSWYDKSLEPLKDILKEGDTYPLDFIIWLRDVIFKDHQFDKLLGFSLAGRLRVYENHNKKGKK